MNDSTNEAPHIVSDTVATGVTLIVDGQAWTVASVVNHLCTATRTDAKGREGRLHCDVREVVAMGAGLFGLAGRIDVPKPSGNASATATAAVADVRQE